MSRPPLSIPDYWTPEQAMAVVDFLDELREHIWAKYELRLLDACRADREPLPVPPNTDDPPF